MAAANWVSSELFGALNRLGKDISESPVTPGQAAELLALVADLQKIKPATSKGIYVKRVTVSSTMGPGVAVDNTTLGLG